MNDQAIKEKVKYLFYNKAQIKKSEDFHSFILLLWYKIENTFIIKD